MFGTVQPAMESIAMVIKPIGYSLLALFAMIEFARLSERVGNVTGFMGAGLVINVLVKLLLCKLVVDNSTEICSFLMTLGDNISNRINSISLASDTLTKTDVNNFINNLDNAYPDGWLDILAKVGFMISAFLIYAISFLSVLGVRAVYLFRMAEIYVYIAISPIPLSTTLSREFNMAPNFLKSFLAVMLQGSLLFIVVKLFTVVMVNQVRSVGVLSSGDASDIWSAFGVLALSAIAMVVAAFGTGRWSKSICNAM